MSTKTGGKVNESHSEVDEQQHEIGKEMNMERSIPCCDWKQKYYDLEKRVAKMQKEMQVLKDKVKKEDSEVRAHCQYFYKSDNTVKTEIKELKERIQMLSNVVIRLDEKFQDTSAKLVDMQARSMRKNLIISGLQEPKNETPEQLREAIKDFIYNKLRVDSSQEIPLKICHRLNYVDGAEYRPVVIKLAVYDHKFVLLSHGPNLKGQKNNKNRFYYLNEQLPDQLSEDRRYAQMWMKENKTRPTSDQLTMKVSKNRLRVNNEPYHKKVKPPSAAEILRLDQQELIATNQAPTVYGDSKQVENSEFISYAVKVSSAEEVRVAYRKLRVRYADAHHIMSAFRLDPPNGPYNQEANDDGEYGGGRAILSVLQDNDVLNVAVFVVRFFGGKHIGAARFDAIKKLTNTALCKVGALQSEVRTSQHNSSAQRRFTRSMSQSVRGKGISAGRSVSTGRMDALASDLPTMFRPTPMNSPNVSPTQIMQQITEDSASNVFSAGDSEYEDSHSVTARETESDSVRSSPVQSDEEDAGDE